MAYTLPTDVDERPVAVDGAGTLCQRIASVYAAGGSDVRIFDTSADQRQAARDYIGDHIDETRKVLGLSPPRTGEVGHRRPPGDRRARGVDGGGVRAERLNIKREVFGELDRVADGDAILASNSSSLPTSQFIDDVRHPERVLNTHYMQPPEQNSVELMSCGETDPGSSPR